MISHGLCNHTTVANIQCILIYHLMNDLYAVSASVEYRRCMLAVEPQGLKRIIFKAIVAYVSNNIIPIDNVHLIYKALGLECLLHSCLLLIDFLTKFLNNRDDLTSILLTMLCHIFWFNALQFAAVRGISAASNSQLILKNVIVHILLKYCICFQKTSACCVLCSKALTGFSSFDANYIQLFIICDFGSYLIILFACLFLNILNIFFDMDELLSSLYECIKHHYLPLCKSPVSALKLSANSLASAVHLKKAREI